MLVQKKKAIKRVDAGQLQKQLRLVTQEAKRLDAHIKDLTRTLAKGHFRML